MAKENQRGIHQTTVAAFMKANGLTPETAAQIYDGQTSVKGVRPDKARVLYQQMHEQKLAPPTVGH